MHFTIIKKEFTSVDRAFTESSTEDSVRVVIVVCELPVLFVTSNWYVTLPPSGSYASAVIVLLIVVGRDCSIITSENSVKDSITGFCVCMVKDTDFVVILSLVSLSDTIIS